MAFQLERKAVSQNKQTTSGAEGREVVPAGCLGGTSAIQSGALGCEANGRESITGPVCLQKDVCGCDSSGSPGGGPLGTRVHHLGSHTRRAREGGVHIQIPGPPLPAPRAGAHESRVSLGVSQILVVSS